MLKISVKDLVLIILSCIILYAQNSYAQKYNFQTYTSDRGLSNNKVYSITQAKNGKMLFATRMQVDEYDGSSYKKMNGSLINSIFDTYLLRDDQGGLWMYSIMNTINLYKFENGTWRFVSSSPNLKKTKDVSILPNTLVEGHDKSIKITFCLRNHPIIQFKNGIWRFLDETKDYSITGIAKFASNIYVSTLKGLFFLENEHLIPSGLFPDARIHCLGIDQNKNSETLWFVANDKLCSMNSDGTRVVLTNRLLDLPITNWRNNLVANYLNDIIITTLDRFIRIDMQTLKVELLTQENGLVDNSPRELFIDKEHNLWIATDRGVSKINGLSQHAILRHEGLLANEVTSLCELKNGSILIGFNNGLAVYNKNNDNSIIKQVVTTSDRVVDIEKASDGGAYVAFYQKKIFHYTASGNLCTLEFPEVDGLIASLSHNNRGELLIMTHHSVYKLSNKNKLSLVFNSQNAFFRKLFVFGEEMFIVTMSSGILHYDGQQWKSYLGLNQTFSSSFAVLKDSKGDVWFGLLKGLYKFIKGNLVKAVIGGQTIDNPVFFIHETPYGLWFGSDNGYYNYDDSKLRHFNKMDGISGNETNRDAFCYTSNGEVIIGTNAGLNLYTPRHDIRQLPPPDFQISAVKVNGEDKALNFPIEVGYGNNSIEVILSIFSYNDENRNQVQYMVEGFDSTWKSPNYRNNILQLPNLTPGTYTLKIRVKNNLSRWSKIYSIELVTIETPYYTSWWFYLILFFITAGIIWLIFTWFQSSRDKSDLEAMVAKRTSELFESENRYRRMFTDNNAIILIIHSDSGMIIDANPAAMKFYRFTRDKINVIDMNYLKEDKYSDPKQYLDSLLENTANIESHLINSQEIKYVNIHTSAIKFHDRFEVLLIIEDITEKLNAEKQLIAREQQFKALVEHTPDVFIRIGCDLIVIYSSPQISDFSGFSVEDIIGKHASILAENKNVPQWVEAIQEVFRTGEPKQLTFSAKKKDDSIVYFDTTILPEYSKDNQIDYVLAINHNITDKKLYEEHIKEENILLENRVKQRTAELENALNDLSAEMKIRQKTEEDLYLANEKLINSLEKEKTLNEMKSRFISMISHEYRTPLTVILSSAYIIKESIKRGLIDDLDRHLIKINSSVSSMSRLLEDVLTFGKSEDGKLSYNPTDLYLGNVLQDIINEVQNIDQKRHEFIFDASVQIVFYTDHYLLRQVLINILINATKFSPIGTPIMIDIANDSQSITIDIIDKGTGISEEDQKHIFEPFFRNEKNIGIIPGTGLGLAIVKRCINMLNGNIQINSKLGEGTKFTIKLPKI